MSVHHVARLPYRPSPRARGSREQRVRASKVKRARWDDAQPSVRHAQPAAAWTPADRSAHHTQWPSAKAGRGIVQDREPRRERSGVAPPERTPGIQGFVVPQSPESPDWGVRGTQARPSGMGVPRSVCCCRQGIRRGGSWEVVAGVGGGPSMPLRRGPLLVHAPRASVRVASEPSLRMTAYACTARACRSCVPCWWRLSRHPGSRGRASWWDGR